MKKSIIGFHKDSDGDWVAELECRHFQHVRHNPPWVNRVWVISKTGRNSMLGYTLECKKCDQQMPTDH